MKKRQKAAQSSGGTAKPPEGRRFQKGQSGNPGGRPKTDPELVEAFREMTPKSIAVLAKVQDDFLRGSYVDEDGTEHEQPKAGDAVAAAVKSLDRAWGTAPATIKLDANVTADVKHDVKADVIQSVDRMRTIVAVLQRAGQLDANTETAAPVETKEEA